MPPKKTTILRGFEEGETPKKIAKVVKVEDLDSKKACILFTQGYEQQRAKQILLCFWQLWIHIGLLTWTTLTFHL